MFEEHTAHINIKYTEYLCDNINKLHLFLIVPVPVNKKEIVLAKSFDSGWSGITHQNNNETCKQNQAAERETDLVGGGGGGESEPVMFR